jgi:hypothetical protein
VDPLSCPNARKALTDKVRKPQHAVVAWWYNKHWHKLTIIEVKNACFVNNALSRLLSLRPTKFFIRCMTVRFVEFHSTQSVFCAKYPAG